ncbi:hypothetical protein KJ780_03110 [Candidatus Micrarchaeota archaeon]|nr:hypothetical protein [Candidatus Micrarchaeota archaeon]
MSKNNWNAPSFVHVSPKLKYPKIRSVDTTLRDGRQMPGVSLTPDGWLKIARRLRDFGVDRIEAGSPPTSKEEREMVRRIRDAGLDEIAGFSRTVPADVLKVCKCGADIVFLVMPSSDLHIVEKLRSTHEAVVAKTLECIKLAQENGAKVEILAEDATRAQPEFLKFVMQKAWEVGVQDFTVCDTVGVANPSYTRSLISYLRDGFDGVLGWHGHNDKGLALANTLTALEAGANSFHGTINSMGERTGNCDIIQIAVNLLLDYGVKTLDLDQAYEVSKLVAALTGISPPRSHPMMGENAFTHVAGIHGDGVMKHADMYRAFDPALVGRRETIILTRLSGTGNLEYKLNELNLRVPKGKMQELLEFVKDMDAQGVPVSDADLVHLVARVKEQQDYKRIVLTKFHVSTAMDIPAHAYVEVVYNGDTVPSFGSLPGKGPVDAVCQSIDMAVVKATNKPTPELLDYNVRSIGSGTDATVSVKMLVRGYGKVITSHGMGDDIVRASAEAYMKAINALMLLGDGNV